MSDTALLAVLVAAVGGVLAGLAWSAGRGRDALWEAVRPPLILGGFAALASILLTVLVGQRLSRRVQELERALGERRPESAAKESSGWLSRLKGRTS